MIVRQSDFRKHRKRNRSGKTSKASDCDRHVEGWKIEGEESKTLIPSNGLNKDQGNRKSQSLEQGREDTIRRDGGKPHHHRRKGRDRQSYLKRLVSCVFHVSCKRKFRDCRVRIRYHADRREQQYERILTGFRYSFQNHYHDDERHATAREDLDGYGLGNGQRGRNFQRRLFRYHLGTPSTCLHEEFHFRRYLSVDV